MVRGNLSWKSLPAIIRELYARRSSGVLHLAREDLSRRILFGRGRIVLVQSDRQSDRLEEGLVERGRIPRSALESALDLATRAGTGVGRALVEMKLMSSEELEEAELQRMKEILYSMFTWTAGEYHFEEKESPVDEDAGRDIPVAHVILEGVRRIDDPGVLRSLVGDSRATLQPAASSALPLFQLKLTPTERGLLEATRLRPLVSPEQLVAGSSLSEVDTLRALYALLSVGLLDIAGTPTTLEPPPVEASPRSAAVEPKHDVKPEGLPASTPAPDSRPRLLGRFEVQRVLGRGSMAEVFRAVDPLSGRLVAVKVVRSAASLSPPQREKYLHFFRQGAQMARRLSHSAIVAVLETGVDEEGFPFLVTEYVQGTTLRDLLASGPLARKHALDLAGQLVAALAYAHSLGVVHRHVKPSNVLVTPQGRVKVKDFGLPRLVSSARDTGLPYWSPEQISKRAIDPRTDVFAVGVVCYRMLTGALPFQGDSSKSLARAIQSEEPVPLERFTPELPPRVARTVIRCLAKDPAERFADAAELEQALRSVEEGVPAPEPREAPRADPGSAMRPTPAVEPSGPPPIRASTPSSASAASPRVDTAPAGPPTASELLDAFERLDQRRGRVAPDPIAESEPEERGGSKEPPRPPPLEVAKESAPEKALRAKPRPPSGKRRFHVAAIALAVVALAAVAATTYLVWEGGTWRELPVSPPPDVLVTPSPAAPPSDEQLAALLAGPTDEALFADASSAFARQDLEESRSKLKELMERDPHYPGVHELLLRLDRLEAERRAAEDRRRRAATAPPSTEAQPAVVHLLTEAELYMEAERALASGDLELSREKLRAVLKGRPDFPGAAELMEVIEHRFWVRTLPKSFAARHNHRLGGCNGTLELTPRGMSFRSPDHEWDWDADELTSMERPDPVGLSIVTKDRDLLGILSTKRFKFELGEALADEDWRFFVKLVETEAATSAP